MDISPRLKKIVEMVPNCKTIADIGTDHGYALIALLKENRIEKGIASDNKKKPLAKAKKNAEAEGTIESLIFRLGNGVETLEPGEVDGVIVAGMGGQLIKDILETSMAVIKELKFILLQPAQNPEVLREYLYKGPYEILDEDIIKEDRRFYEYLLVRYQDQETTSSNFTGSYQVGYVLPRKKHPLFRAFVDNKIYEIEVIVEKIEPSSETGLKRMKNLKSKIDELRSIEMDAKVKDFMKLVESHAPISYKEDYDNVGLMVGDGEDIITGILFSMDTTNAVIEEAKEKGVNLIVSHHPLLFMKPKSITNETAQGKKIIKLIRNNINLYAAHTNLDSVKDGMNDTIVKMFDYLDFDIIEKCPFDFDSGIGRIVYLRTAIKLKDFIEKTKKVLDVPLLRYSGDLNQTVNRIAIINGSGQSYFQKSIELGADCILTADTTYHHVQELEELGVAIVDPGHYLSEKNVYNHLMMKMVKKFNQEFDVPVYFSEVEKDPYQFI